mmetsp:Transcript_148843/g.414702  ORF Transcript_148843/g.414702 Transcript_148843/m.414702 type:complete len:243 (-) Transcript_148843:2931-3659(-)
MKRPFHLRCSSSSGPARSSNFPATSSVQMRLCHCCTAAPRCCRPAQPRRRRWPQRWHWPGHRRAGTRLQRHTWSGAMHRPASARCGDHSNARGCWWRGAPSHQGCRPCPRPWRQGLQRGSSLWFLRPSKNPSSEGWPQSTARAMRTFGRCAWRRSSSRARWSPQGHSMAMASASICGRNAWLRTQRAKALRGSSGRTNHFQCRPQQRQQHLNLQLCRTFWLRMTDKLCGQNPHRHITCQKCR